MLDTTARNVVGPVEAESRPLATPHGAHRAGTAGGVSPRPDKQVRDARHFRSVAPPAGFEPTTVGLEGRCSVH